MDQFSWLQIIGAVAMLILIAPVAIYVFRQKNALANAAVWLALLTALFYGFNKYAYLLPENVKQNFGISAVAPVAAVPEPAQAAPTSDEPESAGPVRNL